MLINSNQMNFNFAVTTSRRPTLALVEEARKLAAELNVSYIDRNDISLEAILVSYRIEGMLVVSSQKLLYTTGIQEFFFHPGLSKLRILEIKSGKTDQMINAMSLQAGFTVLDCTLGLGSDAIVASFAVGLCGHVTGLEGSPVISTLVSRGLAKYADGCEEIAQSMRRVKVVNTGHKEYLANLPSRSFDVVYFDPMFRYPRRHSPAMNAMRSIVLNCPVDREAVDLALQAAARRVVMKERRGSDEFSRLGFEKIIGGRYAPLAYGVIERPGESK